MNEAHAFECNSEDDTGADPLTPSLAFFRHRLMSVECIKNNVDNRPVKHTRLFSDRKITFSPSGK
jgi:hypothetical protein